MLRRLLRISPLVLVSSLPETLMPSRLKLTNNPWLSVFKLTKASSNSTLVVSSLLDVVLPLTMPLLWLVMDLMRDKMLSPSRTLGVPAGVSKDTSTSQPALNTMLDSVLAVS